MLKKVGGCLICKKGLRLYHRIIQTRGTGCNNPLTVKPCNNFPGLPSETSDADLNDKTPVTWLLKSKAGALQEFSPQTR